MKTRFSGTVALKMILKMSASKDSVLYYGKRGFVLFPPYKDIPTSTLVYFHAE